MISASVGLVMTRSLPPASASRSAGRGAAEGVTRNGGAVDTAAGGEGLELGEEGGGGRSDPPLRPGGRPGPPRRPRRRPRGVPRRNGGRHPPRPGGSARRRRG